MMSIRTIARQSSTVLLLGKQQPSARFLASSTAGPNDLSRTNRMVFEVLDEKRGFKSGETLKQYLKAQFKANTISHNETVAGAVDKMLSLGISCLLVIDDSLQVTGVVSDRDYLKFRRKSSDSSDEATKITKIMTNADKIVS